MNPSELTRSFRLANRVLAVSMPIFAIVVILLRDANEALLQGLALAWFFLTLLILFVLDERYRRRQERNQ